MKSTSKKLLSILIITIVGTICYINALSNGFVWDDEYLVKQNECVKSIQPNIGKIFTNNLLIGSPKKSIYYRPVQILSYGIDYKLWGLNPFGYHLTNVLLHILNALLVYYVIKRIAQNELIAFLASALFAIHPVNVAGVTYIAGRAESLFLLFFLLSFSIFINKPSDRKSPIDTIFIIIFFILSLLSKELAIVLPLIFIFYSYIFMMRRKDFHVFFGLMIIVFLYLILRMTVLNFDATEGFVNFYTFNNILKGIVDSIKIFSLYIWLLIIPMRLHMERTVAYFSTYFNIFLYISSIVFFAVTIILLKRYKDLKILKFSLGWFVITILPIMNIFVPLVSEMAEHWLYLPSIGYFMFISTLAINIIKNTRKRLHKSIVIFLIAAVSIYYGITTHFQNRIWKDEFSLYKHILKYRSDDTEVHLNLGSAYSEKGEYDLATQEYIKAIQLNPSYDEAHYNLADVYYKMGKTELAIKEYIIAIKLNPNYIEAHNNLGNIYDEIGRHDEAIEEFKKSLKIKPNHIAYNSLGLAYYNKGLFDAAIEEYKKAIALNPESDKAYINLGNAYYKIGDIDKAKSAWREALRLDPSNEVIRSNLKQLEKHSLK